MTFRVIASATAAGVCEAYELIRLSDYVAVFTLFLNIQVRWKFTKQALIYSMPVLQLM